MAEDDLDKLLQNTDELLDDDEITSNYLSEAKECLKNNLPRSTILLFWSIFMYKLYKKINQYGLPDFLDIVNSKNIKYNGKISTLTDLNKIKDIDILQCVHEIGFFDQNVKGLLQSRLSTRNSIAHVSQVKLTKFTVYEFVNDICQYTNLLSILEMKPDPTFIETVRRMDLDSMKKMMEKMNFSKLESCVEKIYDKIIEITTYDEYKENSNLYEFIINSVETRENERERVMLYEIMFQRSILRDEVRYGSWHIKEKVFALTKYSYIRKLIQEKGYLDQIIALFCDSGSFDFAGDAARSLSNFIDVLNSQQVNKIAKGWLRNNQISQSYGANPIVERILIANKPKLDDEILSDLQKRGMEI